MTLATLALIIAVGLCGPVLAAPRALGIPVVVGELIAGVIVGDTGVRWVHPAEPTLSFLAAAGFALVMLAAGSHVPVNDQHLIPSLRAGAGLAIVCGVAALPMGYLVARLSNTHHGLLYAVLIASSSAALVLPVLEQSRSTSSTTLSTVAQVAIADTVCIVALPLAEQPSKAGHAALGALAVLGVAAMIYLIAREFSRRGWIARLHRLSKERNFGLELRYNLIIVFGLAGLAASVGVSVMLAGFASGIVLAARGEPRRLARQLFALTDGFLAPVFFVWLGASIDLRSLSGHPRMLGLAGLLSVATIVAHSTAKALGQPWSLALMSGAQLGVPVAAATIGAKAHLLVPGEGGAILLAGLVSVGVTNVASRRLGTVVAAPAADT